MEDVVLNARYGLKHTLKHVKNKLYVLDLDPNSTGTYRVIGFDGEDKIGNLVSAIDPEGGPYISVGDKINDMTIKSITVNGFIEFE